MACSAFWYSGGRGVIGLFIVAVVTAVCLAPAQEGLAAEPAWVSPNRYRILLSVNPRGVARSHSPAGPVRINFRERLAGQGGSGTFDEHTVEVVAYEANGQPYVYDASRAGYEQYLLPWRLDKYYGMEAVDLVFVMPDHLHLQYAVYFDTVESGRGRPDRYPGLVGDGDWFRQEYGRREIGPSKFGDMADFDGDGDLDLFEGGVEPFIYCYENLYDQTGEHRFVERGRLTSDGEVLMPSRNLGSNRAWMTVTLCDWDGDGDQDLFPTFNDGPDLGHIVYFRNNTPPGGQTRFTRVDRMYTNTGQPVGGGGSAGWFPTPTFVKDWDGDGDNRTDVIVAKEGYLYLHRNLGPGGTSGFLLANGVRLKAGGVDIELLTPRVDVGDIDGDGDLDLVATTHGAAEWFASSVVFWYRNVGTRQNPQFAAPVALGQMRHYYPGLKIGDFVGNDGLLDIAVGTFWKVNEKHGLPKSYGGLLKNNGPVGNPTFELVLADAGAPYTEQFQICDAGQQNGLRSVNWDGDGDLDLVASTTDGLAFFFRNIGNRLYPVFGPVEQLMVSGSDPRPVQVDGPESGYARLDIADWNNDQLLDLLVGDEEARVFLYLNDGQAHDPPTFQPGTPIQANGRPIDGLGRGSVLVCDWNSDGKKDLIMGMAPKANVSSPYLDWPFQDGDNDKTDDEGFLYYKNVGSDANPVLAYPSWLRAGSRIITYTRPNLGSFVDWDGDGKKDFIGCHFEGNVRFYRNTGSGQPNTEPTLSPAQGTIIVEPFCTTQMISGADAVDFRGDGDLDILTGQGHGGSGLRFYERDFINDFVNNTYPTVSIVTPDSVPPGNVNPLRAYRSDWTTVLLTWVNPSDTDFAGTMIRFRADDYPTSPSDGALVCNRVAGPGSNDSFTHAGASGPLFYTAFAYDTSGNYAAGTQKAASTTWLDEPFDEYNSGSLDGQGGWTKDASNNSCIVQSAAYAGPTGKAVELFGTSVYDGAILANFGTRVGGYHRVSFDMARSTGAAGNQAIIELYGAGKKITRVYWGPGYNMLTGPGASFSSLVTSPAAGRWYHVEIGLNLSGGVIDAWVDGVQKVSGAPFYQSTGQLDTVGLTGYSNATSLSWLDNLAGRRIVTTGGAADFDQDGDVDPKDFALFQACLTGSNQTTLAVGCEDKDLDGDNDVDQVDFGLFQRCYSGEAEPTDLNCAG